LYITTMFNIMVKISIDFHEGPTRGHFGINTTIKKILAYGYWWPTLNKDVAKMCQTCDICQRLTPIWRSNKGPF
jgi:hypothetical protein